MISPPPGTTGGVDAVPERALPAEEHDYDYVAVRRIRRVDSALARLQSWAFTPTRGC